MLIRCNDSDDTQEPMGGIIFENFALKRRKYWSLGPTTPTRIHFLFLVNVGFGCC